MDCETCREALSARLDGETEHVDPRSVDEHLLGCPGCRVWQHQAARLTRAIRIRPAVGTPDLTAAILAVAGPPASLSAARPPAARPPKARTPAARGLAAGGRRPWRWLLGTVALAQLILGLFQLFGLSHMGMAMDADSAHLFNESTAWNLALGAGFGAAAGWPRLAAGLLPTLGVFLVVLTGVSVLDLADGAVGLTRIGSHLLLLAGTALLLAVDRAHRRSPGPGRTRTDNPIAAGEPDLIPDLPAPDDPAPWRGLRPAGRHAA